MDLEPYDPYQGQQPTSRVTLRTVTFLVTILTGLVLAAIGFALGHLGAALAVIFWGGIMAYNISPAYDDDDVDPNPLVKYSAILGLVVVIFLFAVLRHKGSVEEFTSALWSLGWWLLIMGSLFFGSEDWDETTGQKKRTIVRKPGRTRRKRAAKQLIDSRGGVVGDTERLDRPTQPAGRGRRSRRD